MLVNINNLTSLSMADFKKIGRKQSFERIQANPPLTFHDDGTVSRGRAPSAEEQIKLDAIERGVSWSGHVVFDDGNIRITIARRDMSTTNMTAAEIDAFRLFEQIVIFCRKSGYEGVRLYNAELVDKLYEKLIQFAAENRGKDWNVWEARDAFLEAKADWLKLLLSEHLYKMLFATMDKIENGISITQTETQEADQATTQVAKKLIAEFFEEKGLEIACREILDSFIEAAQKINYQVKPDIPVLSEEELSQIEPSDHQRTREGMFYNVVGGSEG